MPTSSDSLASLSFRDRQITDRALALANKIRPQRKHILRRAFFVAASQRHVDRLEIEPGGLDLVQIVDGAVVGVDGEIIPSVDQARGIEDGADIGFAVFRFESRKTAQLRQSRLPTLFRCSATAPDESRPWLVGGNFGWTPRSSGTP